MKPLRHNLSLLLAVLLLAASPVVRSADAEQQEQDFTDLPVTRAVMFSSGVAYFEHAGHVEGNATVQLMFKAGQMNDVLKSMVLMDMDGGSASTISYASKEPLQRALESFGVDLSGDPSLPELLEQLRGAKVTIDNITGTILTVDTQTQVIGEQNAKVEEHILRLVTPMGIQSIKLSTVQTLTFNDPKLQKEMNEALTLLINARDQDRKAVNIRFTGKGRRSVRIGYLIESPVWKTSYRLDLTDKPRLQGWAIVDNPTDNHWDDVRLSLVAGRPISFIQDLYTPYYVDRPVVEPEGFASLRPQRYGEGFDGEVDDLRTLTQSADEDRALASRNALEQRAKKLKTQSEYARQHNDFAAAADQKLAGGVQFGEDAGVQAVASGERVGELFEFTVQHPVSLDRRRAAMLPIVNQAVKAESVSIYNQSVLAEHPLNGAYLTNDTQMKLPAGPITVFDGGAYAGDARIGHMSPGDKRLISYAVDLAVHVDPSSETSNTITGGKIVKGVLHLSRRHVYKQTYIIKNEADEERSMIIEHPFHADRKLIQPEMFEEKTPEVYRFRVPIEANTSGKFVVETQQTTTQTVAIMNSSPNAYLGYIKGAEIDPAVRDALAKAAEMQRELSGLENELKQLQNQKQQIEQGQERLRKNLETVGADTTLGKRYLNKLAEEEDQIEKLAMQIEQKREQVEAKREELAEYVSGLSVGE